MEKTDIRTEAIFHLLFQSSSLTQGVAQRMITRWTALWLHTG